MPPPWLSDESLYVPFCVAGTSLLACLAQFVARRVQKKPSEAADALNGHNGAHHSSLRDYVAGLGGPTAVVLNVLRVLSCLALLSISTYSLTFSQAPTWLTLGFFATYVSFPPPMILRVR